MTPGKKYGGRNRIVQLEAGKRGLDPAVASRLVWLMGALGRDGLITAERAAEVIRTNRVFVLVNPDDDFLAMATLIIEPRFVGTVCNIVDVVCDSQSHLDELMFAVVNAAHVPNVSWIDVTLPLESLNMLRFNFTIEKMNGTEAIWRLRPL